MDTAKSAKERSRKKMNVIIENIISSRVGRFGPIVLFAKTQTAAAPHQPTINEKERERELILGTRNGFLYGRTRVYANLCAIMVMSLGLPLEYYLNIP